MTQKKYLIILQAGTESHEGMARAVHALMYSQELKEAGHDVVLVFDGAGTTWANELRNPEHKLHERYKKLYKLGVTEEICDYCSVAFEVKDSLKKHKDVTFRDNYQGHPSITKWTNLGYVIIVL